MTSPNKILYSALVYYVGPGDENSPTIIEHYNNRLDVDNNIRSIEDELKQHDCKIYEITYLERYTFL